jgi:hypothetical protein
MHGLEMVFYKDAAPTVLAKVGAGVCVAFWRKSGGGTRGRSKIILPFQRRAFW